MHVGHRRRGRAAITILLDEIHALRPAQRKKIENRKRDYVNLVRFTLEDVRTGRQRDRRAGIE
jgi:hypothetical protein